MKTLWEILRKHGLPLDVAQWICNDALLAGVTRVWEPIETAPKTKGARILGWDGSEMVTLDYEPPSRIGINNHIEVGGWWVQVSDSGRSSVYEPTHWQPLPEAPEATA